MKISLVFCKYCKFAKVRYGRGRSWVGSCGHKSCFSKVSTPIGYRARIVNNMYNKNKENNCSDYKSVLFKCFRASVSLPYGNCPCDTNGKPIPPSPSPPPPPRRR